MKKILFLVTMVVFTASLTACVTPSCCKDAEEQAVQLNDCKCGCREGKECTCGKDCKCGCHKGKEHTCGENCKCGCQKGKK